MPVSLVLLISPYLSYAARQYSIRASKAKQTIWGSAFYSFRMTIFDAPPPKKKDGCQDFLLETKLIRGEGVE